MHRIKVNRNKAFNYRFKGKPNNPQVIELLKEIKSDEMKLEQIKSRTAE